MSLCNSQLKCESYARCITRMYRWMMRCGLGPKCSSPALVEEELQACNIAQGLDSNSSTTFGQPPPLELECIAGEDAANETSPWASTLPKYRSSCSAVSPPPCQVLGSFHHHRHPHRPPPRRHCCQRHWPCTMAAAQLGRESSSYYPAVLQFRLGPVWRSSNRRRRDSPLARSLLHRQ